MTDRPQKCAYCGKEKPLSEMDVCMDSGLHRYVCDSECMKNFYNPPKPVPPPGCDRGTMINQNLPRALCNIGHRVDPNLPPGTIEVWQDGQRIGRIENIGLG